MNKGPLSLVPGGMALFILPVAWKKELPSSRILESLE